MRSKIGFVTHSIVRAAVVAGAGLIIGAIPLSSAFAGQAASSFVDQAQVQAESQAHENWRENVRQYAPRGGGCYSASFPSLKWDKVACGPVSGYRSARRAVDHAAVRDLASSAHGTRGTRGTQVVGNGTDYAAQAPSGTLISEAVGSFPSVSGVTTERGVGGNAGTNQYTLQLNTNFDFASAACGSYATGDTSGCFSWQQYVLVSNDVNAAGTAQTGTTDVFIQTWLENYGNDPDQSGNACPAGWNFGGNDSPGDDCYQNSPAAVVSNRVLPITDLASLKLSGTANANGRDTATATFGTQAFSSSTDDSISDIANGWTQTEFNVVGNAGGSQADFNRGSSMSVNVALTDGSNAAPTCAGPSNGGTTGETNNLTLGRCTASAGSGTTPPSIQFTQSN